MKKTVQIVTVPLNKEGWSIGDLVKQHLDKVYWYLTRVGSEIVTVDIDAQAQQLLVISDDNTKDVLCLWDDNVIDTCLENNENVEYGKPKKIIASYPQLEGTLPISKETVQAWIDAGTPGEGSVVLEGYEYNGVKLETPPELCEFKTKLNSQGNLLLEFDKNIIDTLPYPELVKELSEYYKDTTIVDKPSIPTDEEIEEKAKVAAIKGTPFSTRIHGYAYMYQAGYKQALKDLGHE